MIDEKQIDVDGQAFFISKFPAVQGREIVTQYMASSIPKLGDYKRNEELMIKLMAYVQIELTPGSRVALSDIALINKYVPSWEMLAKIEMGIMEYNCSFFQRGLVSNFLEGLAPKVTESITKIMTSSLEQLFQKEKQPSTN